MLLSGPGSPHTNLKHKNEVNHTVTRTILLFNPEHMIKDKVMIKEKRGNVSIYHLVAAENTAPDFPYNYGVYKYLGTRNLSSYKLA